MTIFIRIIFSIMILFGAGSLQVLAQSASILPPGKTTFFDANGNPLSSGKVYFYIPSTTTTKTTWQDANEKTANANPVVLDSAGRALIYGNGSYRQIVKDKVGNTIWDALTSSTGTGGGGSGATGDGDLVGTIKPWAGLTAPNQYLFAYGQEISRTTYATLMTAITLTGSVTCALGSPTLTNLADTTQIPIGGAIEVTCLSPGATVISKTTTTITVTANAISTTVATAVIFPYGNGDGLTTFNLPDLRGRAVAGRDNMGGTASSRLAFGAATGATGGSQNQTLLTANLPAYTPSGTINDPGHSHTVAGTQAVAFQGGATASALGLGGTFNTGTKTTGITFTGVAQGGTSTAFSVVQPTITLNYIIKVTPDSSTAVSTGVTALGGMTGDIACGSGLLCTGNTVSLSVGISIGYVNDITQLKILTPGASSIVYVRGYSTIGDGGGGTFAWDSTNVTVENGCTIFTPNAGGTGRWVRSYSGAINVRWCGTKGDDVTNDTVAVQAAMTLSQTTDPTTAFPRSIGVYFPTGIYRITSVATTVCNLFGDSNQTSIIRRVNANTDTTLISCGYLTAVTTSVIGATVHDLSLQCSSQCSDAILKLRNHAFSRYYNLTISGGSNICLRSTGAALGQVNTTTASNQYYAISVSACGGNGFSFEGEKVTSFDQLLAQGNTGNGFVWSGFGSGVSGFDSNEENNIGSIIATSNGGSGVVFDDTEKFTVDSIVSIINSGYGVRFLTSSPGAQGTNNVQVGSLTLRNNALGHIRVADQALVDGASFANIIALFGTCCDTQAILLRGVSNVSFGNVYIRAYPGTAFQIEAGDPLGVVTQSSNIQIANLDMQFNGNGGSVENNGIYIKDSTTRVLISNINSINSVTSVANYEVNISATATNITISNAYLQAFGGVANNINPSATTYIALGTQPMRLPAGTAALPEISWANGGTTGLFSPSANITGFTVSGTEIFRIDSGGVKGAPAGTAATLNITGGVSTTGAAKGGEVAIVGGTPGTGGIGGEVNLTGGASSSTADGPPVRLIGGASGTGATGAGGFAAIVGGAAKSTNGAGGTTFVFGGAATGTGAGGIVSIGGGAGGSGATGNGGLVQVTGGNANSTNGNGGAFTGFGGIGKGTGTGGALQFTSGQGGATGAGGTFAFTSGAGGSTSGASGTVAIASGTTTAGSGSATGDVLIRSGTGAASAVAVVGGASGALTVSTANAGANTGGASGQVGGAAGAFSLIGGDGGATNSVGAHAGGAGSVVMLQSGTGGNATAGTGNGGAGGNINLFLGTGGTSAGGTAGANGVLSINGDSNFISATYFNPGTAVATNRVFYTATRTMKIVSARVVFSTAAGGASTAEIKKDTGTGAPCSGSTITTATFDLNATANTVQSGTIVTTSVATLAAGDRLCLQFNAAILASDGVSATVGLTPQ